MRGAESAKERGAEGTDEVGSGEEISPPQLRWDLGGVPLPKKVL